MSVVDSEPSGRPPTGGTGCGTSRMRGDSSSGTPPSLEAFFGVHTKVAVWPRRASRLDSSRKGIMWPKASYGNTIMWRDFCFVSAMNGLASCILGSR
ncbi:hypothetical protein PR202_gb12613 [Eleusine coracana subsp. coracana]|uniref:Uncharacterized protein n=1 Tax=Eleusine coracana subsp. coracana TaxID=191504 RepID=A0AAV5EQC3_ELECO|nr:hypothetical protein PR202_gb12613 [Eleusine coracana subsp. coracana]